MKITFKNREVSASAQDKLSFSHKGRTLDTDINSNLFLTVGGDLDLEGYVGNSAKFAADSGLHPPFHIDALDDGVDFAYGSITTEGFTDLVVLATRGAAPSNYYKFVNVDASLDKLVLKDRSAVDTDLLDDFDKFKPFWDFVNSKLHRGKEPNNFSHFKGFPRLTGSGREKNFVVPLSALKLYADLFLSYTNAPYPSEIPSHVYQPHIGASAWVNFSMLRDISPRFAEIFFGTYDWSKLISPTSPALDQLILLALGGEKRLSVNDKLTLIVPQLTKSSVDVNQLINDNDRIMFDGGSRACHDVNQNDDTYMAELKIDRVIPSYTVLDRWTQHGEETHPNIEDVGPYLVNNSNPGFAGVYEKDSERVDTDPVVSVDQRVGAFYPFFLSVYTDYAMKYLPVVRTLVSYTGKSLIPDHANAKYFGPNFKGHFFEFFGMTIMPLTYLDDGDSVYITPVRYSNAGQVSNKAFLNLFTSEGSKAVAGRETIFQHVGGNRVASLVNSPGSLTLGGLYEIQMFHDNSDDTQGAHEGPASPCDPCELIGEVMTELQSMSDTLPLMKDMISQIGQTVTDERDISAIREQLLHLVEKVDSITALGVNSQSSCSVEVDKLTSLFNSTKDKRVQFSSQSWISGAQSFGSLKLSKDGQGKQLGVVYDSVLDDIVCFDKDSIKIGDNDIVKGATSDSVRVPKFGITIGGAPINFGREHVGSSARFLNTDFFVGNPRRLSSNLLNGSLFKDDSPVTRIVKETYKRSFHSEFVRVEPVLLVDDLTEVSVAGYVRLSSYGYFVQSVSQPSSTDIYLPIYVVKDGLSKNCVQVVVHPSYPDVWIQGCLAWLSVNDIVAYVDRGCLSNIFPTESFKQLEANTRNDIYLRRRAMSLAECSSVVMIEVMKYDRVLLNVHPSRAASIGPADRLTSLLDMHFFHDDYSLRSQIRGMGNDGLPLTGLRGVTNQNIFTFSDNLLFAGNASDNGESPLCACDILADGISLF